MNKLIYTIRLIFNKQICFCIFIKYFSLKTFNFLYISTELHCEPAWHHKNASERVCSSSRALCALALCDRTTEPLGFFYCSCQSSHRASSSFRHSPKWLSPFSIRHLRAIAVAQKCRRNYQQIARSVACASRWRPIEVRRSECVCFVRRWLEAVRGMCEGRTGANGV